MIDAKHLLRFKRVTSEDLLVAGLIESICDTSTAKSILDIGAGTGLISLSLQRSSRATVTVVDSASIYSYPADFTVVCSDWATVELKTKFDLIIMSHILGDFPVDRRGALLQKAIEAISDDGQIISVENGPDVVFDNFVAPLFSHQGDEFNIDSTEIERVFSRNGLRHLKFNFKTYLPLGSSIEEAAANANLFFPRVFSDAESSVVTAFIDQLQIGDRFVLPVNQQIYLAGRAPRNLMSTSSIIASSRNESPGAMSILDTFFLTEVAEKSLSEAISVAGFDYVNPDVLNHFSGNFHGSPGQFAIVKFDRVTTSNFVEQAIRDKGYIPASVFDLVRFAAEMPRFQQSIPVIALGSAWQRANLDCMVPAIWGGERSRDLNMCSWGTRWFAGDGFLARKV